MPNYLVHRRLLLSRGAKPNSLGWKHRPIIFSAIRLDSSAIVQVILDFKGDLEYCGGTNKETPLLWAAVWGSLSCLKLLLKVANTGATDSAGKGVLSVAICHHRAAVAEILLQRPEVDVLLSDKHGKPPLRHAVLEGQHRVVQTLLENPQVEASMRDAANQGILHEAVQRSHLGVVRALLSCESVTRSSRRLRDGFSPIHCAVKGSRYLPIFLSYKGDARVFLGIPSRKILKVLLESSLFDVNAADDDGMTALHHVCALDTEMGAAPESAHLRPRHRMDYETRDTILPMLCSAPGINLDVLDHRGETALYKALDARNIAHIKVLTAKGPSLHVKGAKQITCTLSRSCRRDPVIFRDLNDFEAHLTERHGEHLT